MKSEIIFLFNLFYGCLWSFPFAPKTIESRIELSFQKPSAHSSNEIQKKIQPAEQIFSCLF